MRVAAIAHGGHCVARHEGRVIFLRHALPGETVLAEVTEDRGGSFCRADAVQVLEAAPERVRQPCPYAHPGGCGGCDFQHVSLPGQRALKAAVVAEQLSRLAGLEREVEVQPLDDGDGLGWRRRVRFAVGPQGELGLHAHRSHRVVPLTHCPIGAPGVGDAEALQSDWPGLAELEVAVDDRGEAVVLARRPRRAPRRQGSNGRGRRGERRSARPELTTEQLSGPAELQYAAGGHRFTVHPAGFWQTHPRAAEVFTETVLRAAAPRPGDRVLDLYAGSGLFTAALAAAVTGTGRVLGLEAEREAVADAARNLAGQPWAELRRAAVSAGSVAAAVAELAAGAGGEGVADEEAHGTGAADAGAGGEGVDIVVLDPPRSGAGREVVTAILAASPRVVVYVACDPAALARDIRVALDAGWRLDQLSAFDAFPMTHHVECIAVLRPGADNGPAGPGDEPSESGTVQVG